MVDSRLTAIAFQYIYCSLPELRAVAVEFSVFGDSTKASAIGVIQNRHITPCGCLMHCSNFR